MNKKANVIIEAIIMAIIVCLLLFAVISIAETKQRHFCKDKGYHTNAYWQVSTTYKVEEGYIKCCNDIIQNHTYNGLKCDTFNYKNIKEKT